MKNSIYDNRMNKEKQQNKEEIEGIPLQDSQKPVVLIAEQQNKKLFEMSGHPSKMEINKNTLEELQVDKIVIRQK